jgi:hypothetical protein
MRCYISDVNSRIYLEMTSEPASNHHLWHGSTLALRGWASTPPLTTGKSIPCGKPRLRGREVPLEPLRFENNNDS